MYKLYDPPSDIFSYEFILWCGDMLKPIYNFIDQNPFVQKRYKGNTNLLKTIIRFKGRDGDFGTAFYYENAKNKGLFVLSTDGVVLFSDPFIFNLD